MTIQHKRFSFAEQTKLTTLLLGLGTLLLLTDWLWRWDLLLYDANFRVWSQDAPNDAVIVAIDEDSLAAFGRWPWNRQLHADLIDTLNEAGAKTIVVDIIFSEPASQEDDARLADAIKNAGNVVLPVLVEQSFLGGQLKETLPLPRFIEAGAALGHVHVELDSDGIARRTHRKEGLGAPHWQHLSAAALDVSKGRYQHPKSQASNNENTFKWMREGEFLIPYSGPPGEYPRVSYSQVLAQQFLPETFKDKVVFVGVTAAGLGDSLPTPVSGLSHPMPGVEINANVYTALKTNHAITTIDTKWQFVTLILSVLLIILTFPRLSPRGALLFTIGLISATALLIAWHLQSNYIWFPPAALLVTLAAAYPLWSWRRLEFTLRYLNSQLDQLNQEPGLIPHEHHLGTTQRLTYLNTLLHGRGWILFDSTGNELSRWTDLKIDFPGPLSQTVTQQHDRLWIAILEDKQQRLAGVALSDSSTINEHFLKFIHRIFQANETLKDVALLDSVGLLERRTLQVEAATNRLRSLRKFFADSLDQMADGFIIVSISGQVLLSNKQAARLLDEHSQAIEDAPLHFIIKKLPLAQGQWHQALKQALIDKQNVRLQSSTQATRDLLINIAPLDNDGTLDGLIINLSDITPIKEAERRRNELINFLSHDMRSPLSSSLATIEIFKLDTENRDIDKTLERIQSNTNTALQLTEDFVQLSRAENADVIEFQESDLIGIVYNALDITWDLARKKQIEVAFNHDNLDSALVHADANLLERAVTNLITNAIKYSPEKTCTQIALEAAPNNTFQISVRDQGYGIEKDQLPKLFDRFARIHREEHAKESGIGLGLAFVETVVAKHHGKIEVDSEINVFTEFKITLPRQT